MKLGAIHRPTPAHVPALQNHVALERLQIPPVVDWFAKCPADGRPLLNDQIGNCVPCAALRSIELRRHITGDRRAVTDDQAAGLYRRWGGYDGTPSTDHGCVTTDAMADWSAHGYWWAEQWEDVPTWVQIRPQRVLDIRAANWLFGGVLATIALPAIYADGRTSWTETGTLGEAAPASWGYHRVLIGMATQDEMTVRTWGHDILMSWDAWAVYGVAADAVVSRSWMYATGESPPGFDLTMLEAEAARLTL